jgi:AcrR family transcriptional regulator
MASDRSRRPTKAEASAETRSALLEAGAALLRDEPVGTVLNQIKAPVVARLAGRTTGAFYHHWTSQDAYQRDLLAYVLDPARIPSTTEAAAAIMGGLQQGVPAQDLLRSAANALFASVRADPFVPLWFGLWARQGSDAQVHDLLHEHYRAVTRQTRPLYEALLAAAGRRLRPPFTADTFAVTITAVCQGLALRVAVEPAAVPLDLPGLRWTEDAAPTGEPWDLFSTLVWTLLHSMSDPISAENEPRPGDESGNDASAGA